jgi:hypothetical protein
MDVSGLVSKFGDDTAPTKSGMKFAVTSGEPDFRTLTSRRRTLQVIKHTDGGVSSELREFVQGVRNRGRGYWSQDVDEFSRHLRLAA